MVHDYFRRYLINHPKTKLLKKKKPKRSKPNTFTESQRWIIRVIIRALTGNSHLSPPSLVELFRRRQLIVREIYCPSRKINRNFRKDNFGRGDLSRDRGKNSKKIDSINARFVETEKFGFAEWAPPGGRFEKLDRVVRRGN